MMVITETEIHGQQQNQNRFNIFPCSASQVDVFHILTPGFMVLG